jgi:hypothetical protein
MDLRICRICEKQFDIDSLPLDIRVVDSDDSHFTFIEKKGYGACHVLMRSAYSAERIEQMDEVKCEVRQVEPKPPESIIEDFVESAEPILVSEIIESEQLAVSLEDLVEPEAEPSVEEFDGYIEEVNSEYGSGFIRVVWQQRQDFTKVVFDSKDVVTEGEIKVGKMVRFQVAPPDPGRTMHRAREIKIYQDCEEAT